MIAAAACLAVVVWVSVLAALTVVGVGFGLAAVSAFLACCLAFLLVCVGHVVLLERRSR